MAAAVTLVVGDEELLVSRAVQRAVAAAAAVGPGEDVAAEATRTDIYGSDLTLDDLTEALSPSLFADDRLLVVWSVQDVDKPVAEALTRAAEMPEPGVTLVLVHVGGVKGKAVLESLKGAGAQVVVAAKVKSAREREQFVTDEARAVGGTLDRDAAATLVAAVGADLRELSTAAQQLVSDVGRQVTADDVTIYYQGRAESSGFAVADRAVEGNAAAALETLRWAFATGLDPVLVSSSLAANLRLIAIVAAAGRGSPDSLAGPLGMPAWKIRRAQGWVRRWRPEGLAQAVAAVAAADADLKGAGDDAAYAVERAVLAVASAVVAV